MQDRYVGDVGDFGKYALLRALCGQFDIGPTFPLGIVWCLFPDESHNSDGRHTSYLDRDEYRILDPGLHDCLKEIVNDNNRSVAAIQAAGMLPKSTIFVDALASGVCEEGEGWVPARRERYRRRWLEAALNATDDCAIVFLDPDNGLSVASINKRHSKAGKYVFWDELEKFTQRDHSTVVYHHFNRTSSVRTQVDHMIERLRRHVPSSCTLMCLDFLRGSRRAFWLLLKDPFTPFAQDRVARLLASGWNKHFQIAYAE